MKPALQRAIVRWVHLICAFPMLGYIYGPAEEVEQYAPVFRYFFVPVVVATGFWLWKGHLVKRLFTKTPEAETPAEA